MKSRAIVHSKYESRLVGVRTQGSSMPTGVSANLLASRTQGRLATGQTTAQSLPAGYRSQSIRLPKA